MIVQYTVTRAHHKPHSLSPLLSPEPRLTRRPVQAIKALWVGPPSSSTPGPRKNPPVAAAALLPPLAPSALSAAPESIASYLQLNGRGFSEMQMIESVAVLQTSGGDEPMTRPLLAADGCLDRGFGLPAPQRDGQAGTAELLPDGGRGAARDGHDALLSWRLGAGVSRPRQAALVGQLAGQRLHLDHAVRAAPYRGSPANEREAGQLFRAVSRVKTRISVPTSGPQGGAH